MGRPLPFLSAQPQTQPDPFAYETQWDPEGASVPPGRQGPELIPSQAMRGGAGIYDDPDQPYWGSRPPPSHRAYYAMVPVAWVLPAMDAVEVADQLHASSHLYLGTLILGGSGHDLPSAMTAGNNPAEGMFLPGTAGQLYDPTSGEFA